jgi:hypothetical protein
MYPALVTLSLILVFGSSAIMSISGLLSIFSNNTLIIVCMGIGIEGGKILTISHLYRSWEKNNGLVKAGYIFIIFVLTLLTSFEVMGFLSQCHQKTIQANHVIQSKIGALNNEESVLQNQINLIDAILKGLPESHVTRRIQERKKFDYGDKQNRLLEIIKQRSDLETQIISQDDNINPVSSIAKIFKVRESNIVSIFIPLLVLILEPLSIGLTIAANSAWMNYKKNKESIYNEISQNDKDHTKDLRKLQEKNHLTISQIAKITGRKKLKTCEGWLKGTIPTPPRALNEIRVWVKKQGISQKPISLIQAGGEK